MLHGVAYGQYTHQEGRRGGWQFGSINWLMLSAVRPTAGGRVELRAMGSAEPWTLGKVGYPLLLQTGETYQGVPLHDRQHPHDLAMELSTTFEQRLAGPVSASLYLAAVGEPAAGPVAFMHRPSAAGDPFAPLSHHWQDGQHVTFGVVTAGLFTRHVKLEGSLFNGREPDEVRTNFDYSGRRLDSWSARLTLMPAPNWALSGWYAYFESPEALRPADWTKHVGASVLHSRPIGRDGAWSSAVIWGAKKHETSLSHPITRLTHSVTAETSVEIGRRNTLFARADYVQKDMEELFLPHLREEIHEVRILAAGYVLDVARARAATLGIGVRGAVNFIPDGARHFLRRASPRWRRRLRPPRVRAKQLRKHDPAGARRALVGGGRSRLTHLADGRQEARRRTLRVHSFLRGTCMASDNDTNQLRGALVPALRRRRADWRARCSNPRAPAHSVERRDLARWRHRQRRSHRSARR